MRMKWTRHDDKVILESQNEVENKNILNFWKYLEKSNNWMRTKNFPFLQSKNGKVQIVFSREFDLEKGLIVCQ